MSEPSEDLDAEFNRARELVEKTLARLGLDPAQSQRKSSPHLASWAFKRGSAAVLVTIAKADRGDAVYLRVASPVMFLPPPENHLALFRRLLELNGQGLANAAFALFGNEVMVASERPTQGLDIEEVEQIVRHLSAVADTYDDRLVKEFGGRRCSDGIDQ
jgi:hypothetical protein